MGAKSGIALKFLQWFVRGIQFLCAALILGVYSYFLAALHDHDLRISNDVRAVEGISGAAVLYTLIALLLLCCLAGRSISSFIAMVLDVAFIGAFIYVAVANRHGAGSCNGYLDTPFGSGQSGNIAQGTGGFTRLPRYRTACKLQTACFAVSIVAIIFFIFSILVELALVRHHRKEKRFGPSPANNYTSGYGEKRAGGRGGLLGRLFRRNGASGSRHAQPVNDNALPTHTQPDQLDGRQSYATETTAVNHPAGQAFGGAGAAENGMYKKQDPAFEPATNHHMPQTGTTQPQDYRYNDGVYDRVAGQ